MESISQVEEGHFYMAVSRLYEDIGAFVEEPVKVFGLKKHKRMLKNLRERLQLLVDDFVHGKFYTWPYPSLVPPESYEDFFFAAVDAVEDTYALAIADSKFFKTVNRKRAASEAFVTACASYSKFRAAKHKLDLERDMYKLTNI